MNDDDSHDWRSRSLFVFRRSAALGLLDSRAIWTEKPETYAVMTLDPEDQTTVETRKELKEKLRKLLWQVTPNQQQQQSRESEQLLVTEMRMSSAGPLTATCNNNNRSPRIINEQQIIFANLGGRQVVKSSSWVALETGKVLPSNRKTLGSVNRWWSAPSSLAFSREKAVCSGWWDGWVSSSGLLLPDMRMNESINERMKTRKLRIEIPWNNPTSLHFAATFSPVTKSEMWNLSIRPPMQIGFVELTD